MENKLKVYPVMLPGNGPILSYSGDVLETIITGKGSSLNRHLYLVSERDIKEGDWYIEGGELKQWR